MKTYILYLSAVVSAFLVATLPSYSQYRTDDISSSLYDSETASSLRRHVNTIASPENEGREAGSDGEKSAAAYLHSVLEGYGIEMLSPEFGDEFGVASESGDTLTSRNVIGFVQGYDPKLRDKYIVIGARMDNLGVNEMTVDGRLERQIYYGANGNASGMAVMMELARMVATNSILFRRSVLFIGFGASSKTFAGAWYFLNRQFAETGSIDMMINLDMLGTGTEGFYAYTASNKDMNSMLSEMAGQLQPAHPQVIAYEPYPSDHRAFYSKEIPSVFFTTGRYSQHNTTRDSADILDFDMMERELEYIYNFTVAASNVDECPLFRPEERKTIRQSSTSDVVSFFDCDYKPAFLNNMDPRHFLAKWVYPYVKYPQKAVEDGISGTVMVEFIIEKDGKLTNAKVVKSVHSLLDDEALKVISASPKWKPGRRAGQKVRTIMTIPVEFRLEKKTGKGNFGINGRRF